MPSAYGSDRVTAAGGAFVIAAPRDKGWRARTPATRTSAEFPGSAVEWDGVVYEVVARTEAGSGVRYRLEPWREHHTVRHMQQYDEASEAERLAQFQENARRARIGRALQHFGILIGLLPAEAQRHIATRFGVSIARLTLYSTVPFMIFGLYCARYIRIHHDLPYEPPWFPEWMIPFGIYLSFESMVRLRAWLGSNPMGSILGWIVYLPWWLFGGRKVLEAIEKEELQLAGGVTKEAAAKAAVAPRTAYREVRTEWGDLPEVEADAERKLHDAFIMRAPYISFLSPREQVAMHERFGFDPIAEGKRTAVTITIIAGLGATISIFMMFDQGMRFSRLLSAFVAVLLVVEQFGRMRLLSEGEPAPSVLGPIVRPFLRKVLDAPPVQPVFEGEARNVELPSVWEGDE